MDSTICPAMRPSGCLIGTTDIITKTVLRRIPQDRGKGDRKVLRGGSWEDEPRNIRVTSRATAEPGFSDLTIGFRCAKDAKK